MVAVYAPDAAFSGSALPRDIYLTTRRTGLVGEFLFGLDLAQSRENSAKADAAPAAESLIGGPVPPVYGDHRVNLGNGAGLASGIVASPAQTIFIVSTVAATDVLPDGASSLVSILLHGASAAQSGRANTTVGDIGGTPRKVALIAECAGAVTGSASFPAATPYTAPRTVVSKITGAAVGSTVSVEEFLGGVRTGRASIALTAVRETPTYGIIFGNSNTVVANAGYQARVNFIAALVYNRAVPDDEELSIYLELRANLASMGVTT